MKKQGSPLYVRVPADLLERIERFRGSQTIRPTMTETMKVLVERGLNEVEGENAGRTGSVEA